MLEWVIQQRQKKINRGDSHRNTRQAYALHCVASVTFCVGPALHSVHYLVKT
jgi:hypothetical protein